jgi:hypothetical protein
MGKTSAIDVTINHVHRVKALLDGFRDELQLRGDRHDLSKLDPVEAGPLQTMQDLIDTEGQAPFGSDEYRRRTALLGPMLAHHYANNSHHPEHYPDGVAGMDLFDIVEMFADWKAASERGHDSQMGLSYCIEKYAIPPMLASILRNTADRLGWKHG